jgi:hypothetical protein
LGLNERLLPQRLGALTNTATFLTMGFNSCFSDRLLQWSDPDQNTAYNIEDRTVFNYP